METKKEAEKENPLFPSPKKKLPKPVKDQPKDDSMGKQGCHDRGAAVIDVYKD